MAEHDRGYRQLFSDPRLVKDLITGFIEEPWVAEIDFSTLEQIPNSFVSETFQRRESDVIWRVKLRGQTIYVYLLIEFQSSVDWFMALRLMVYVGLLYQHLLETKQLEQRRSLPPVLPIVLYNGTRKWGAPLDVADLLADCPEGLKRYQPQMRYFLLAEQSQEESKLAGMNNLTALLFRFEKCRTPDDFHEVCGALAEWARTPEHWPSVKRIVQWFDAMLWPRRSRKPPPTELDDFREGIAVLKERIKIWRKEILAEGLDQGREKGEAEVLLRQLERKFGPLEQATIDRVRQAGSEKLLQWAERILTAESLDDVFA